MAAGSTGESKTWIKLDGPVDALWVENLNTVLDDSRRLCLASGERMSLSAQRMNVMFEVDDLSAASPATISRCGMVYVPVDMLTWRVLLDTWLTALPAILAQPLSSAAAPGAPHAAAAARARLSAQGAAAHDTPASDSSSSAAEAAPRSRPVHAGGLQGLMAQLRGLFDQHMDSGLQWLRRHAQEPVPQTLQQRLRAVCGLLAHVVHPESGWEHSDEHGSAEAVALANVFAFAFVWGLGGGLAGDSRAAWDTEVRRSFHGKANFPAGAGLVFDYCCNPARNYAFQVRSVPPSRPASHLTALLVPCFTCAPHWHASAVLGRCYAHGFCDGFPPPGPAALPIRPDHSDLVAASVVSLPEPALPARRPSRMRQNLRR